METSQPKERNAGAVTLRQVAALASVSPVVVSRVLHHKALSINVTKETAERVFEAARALGYRKNVTAVNFRSGQTWTIGILHGIDKIMPLLGTGPRYFAALVDGIVDGAFRHGYSVTLCPKLLGATPETGISDGRFDGLLVFNMDLTEKNLSMLKMTTSPLVVVQSRSHEIGCDFPSVICDNAQGIRLAFEHLYELGHRKIGYLEEETVFASDFLERRAAFLGLAEEYGLDSGPDQVFRPGRLHEVFDHHYTAIISSHDESAAILYEAAAARGVIIPEELSVVGFDSTSYCNELRPALTSVYQPLHAIGAKAADLLVARIRERLSDYPDMVLPCRFDVRESTAPPPTVR